MKHCELARANGDLGPIPQEERIEAGRILVTATAAK